VSQEALSFLFKGRKQRTKLSEFLKEEETTLATLVEESKQEPSARQLLALKDKLYISDHNWAYVVKTFSLKYGTIARLKKVRSVLNEEAQVKPTRTGNGAQRCIVKLLEEMFTRRAPATDTVRVKFAFDGRISTK
jgi:hypothetical protein